MILPAAHDTAGTTPRRFRLADRSASAQKLAGEVHTQHPVPLLEGHLVEGASLCRPAVLTRISRVPNAAHAAANIEATSASRETSAFTATAREPRAVIWPTTSNGRRLVIDIVHRYRSIGSPEGEGNRSPMPKLRGDQRDLALEQRVESECSCCS